MGPVPGLNAGWSQIVISAFTMHDQALPPVPPVPAIPGLVEGPAVMGWPPGRAAGSHQTGNKVNFDGNPAVQEGHDVGILIPHFAIPMNALCGVNTLFSTHKVLFPVTSVLIEGKPLGTYVYFLLGEICCDPISLPTGVVILLKCTVWSSLSAADVARGFANLAADIMLDLISNKIAGSDGFKKQLGKLVDRLLSRPSLRLILRKVAEQLLKGIAGKVLPPAPRAAAPPALDGRGGFPSHTFFQ